MSERAKKAAHNVAELARRVITEDLADQLAVELGRNLERMDKGGSTEFVVTITGTHKHDKVITTVCNVSGKVAANAGALG